MPADWDTGPDLVKVAAIIALFASTIVGVWAALRNDRRKNAMMEAERREKIKQAAAEGIADGDGNPLCVVCGAIATRPTVRTGRPWFDTLPIIRTLDRLWARSPRYSIVEDWESGPRLCAADRRNAEMKLERVHANWRARHAEFNAEIMEESSVLDQGGLEQVLRAERSKIRAKFIPRARTDSAAALAEPEDDEVHLLPVSSGIDPEESQH